MEITRYNNRKPVGKVSFPKVDDSSFSALVASIGGEHAAFVALKRYTTTVLQAWANKQVEAGVVVSKAAATYQPNFASSRRKSPVQKTVAQLQGITDPVLRAQMLADLKAQIAEMEGGQAGGQTASAKAA